MSCRFSDVLYCRTTNPGRLGKGPRTSSFRYALHMCTRKALAAAILLIAASAWAGTVSLQFQPLRADSMFLAASEESDSVPVPAEPDRLVVVGRFDDASFSVDTLSQVKVMPPGRDAEPRPLTFDESATLREFGSIVSVTFYFTVSAAVFSNASRADFRLVWGPDVDTANRTVPRLALDPSGLDHYRTFQWQAAGDEAGGSDDMSVTTIEVIADRNANLYSLWYLLPMAMIFILLTIRKLRYSHGAPGNHTG